MKPNDTIARLRARSTEAGRFVLPLDRVWADKVQEATLAVNTAEGMPVTHPDRGSQLATAQLTLDDLVAKVGDNAIIFRFRRISRAEYDGLVSAHPPTKEQIEEDKAKQMGFVRVFDNDTFGPHLLCTVMIDPVLSLEEATELLNGPKLSDNVEDVSPLLSSGEAQTLLNTAMTVSLAIPRQIPDDLKLP